MDRSVLAGPFATGLISSIFLDAIEIPGDGDTSAANAPRAVSYNLVPRAFPSKNGPTHFLREKPWGRG